MHTKHIHHFMHAPRLAGTVRLPNRRAPTSLRSVLGKMRRRLGARLPLRHDPELAEAGLACMSMLAGYHGLPINHPGLRRAIMTPFSYLTLAQMIQSAGIMGLQCRPVRIQPAGLAELTLPAILQMQAGHYVVLKSWRKGRLTLHDPLAGVRTLSQEALSQHFTGIAIEVEPGGRFCERTAGDASRAGAVATRSDDHDDDPRAVLLTLLLFSLALLAVALTGHFELG